MGALQRRHRYLDGTFGGAVDELVHLGVEHLVFFSERRGLHVVRTLLDAVEDIVVHPSGCGTDKWLLRVKTGSREPRF